MLKGTTSEESFVGLVDRNGIRERGGRRERRVWGEWERERKKEIEKDGERERKIEKDGERERERERERH